MTALVVLAVTAGATWIVCSIGTAVVVARGIRLAEKEDRPSVRRTAYSPR